MEEIGGRARDSVSKERAIPDHERRRGKACAHLSEQKDRPPGRRTRKMPCHRATGEPPEIERRARHRHEPANQQAGREEVQGRGEEQARQHPPRPVRRGEVDVAGHGGPVDGHSRKRPRGQQDGGDRCRDPQDDPLLTRQAPPVQQGPGGEQEQHDDDTEHDRGHPGPERIARRVQRLGGHADRGQRLAVGGTNRELVRRALDTTLEPRADAHRNHRLRQRVLAAPVNGTASGERRLQHQGADPRHGCRPDRSNGWT